MLRPSAIGILFLLVHFAPAYSQKTAKSQLEVLPSSGLNQPLGSATLPLDSWIYPPMLRLIALGYVSDAYLGLRPWTRDMFVTMLHEAGEQVTEEISSGSEQSEAEQDYAALTAFFAPQIEQAATKSRPAFLSLDRVYTENMGIGGEPLRDSYHFGATRVNDNGRPYGKGYSGYSGFLVHGGVGRFTLQARGEYQRSPGLATYPLSAIRAETDADEAAPDFGLDTAAANRFRLLDAYASTRWAGHEFSIGKREDWWGPGEGGAMAWSDNAEPIYAFRIDRVRPLFIPLLSRITGPFRYEAFFGHLQGQTFPRSPWVHAEKFSFKPTSNLEFGFARVVVFAGEGHVPLTFGSFWHSFSSFSNVSLAEKNSRQDPGARHSAFDFSYRLPYVRNWVTLYTDSIVHDDTSPLDAPRHTGFRAGLYLPRLPKAHELDLRVEAATTDPPIEQSVGGKYLYWEGQYRQAYTNQGQILGDAIGREGKGGQATLRWWIAPHRTMEFNYRRAKVAKDFIAGGSTQNDASIHATLLLRHSVELRAWVQGETWDVPALAAGERNDVSGGFELSIFPGRGHDR